MTYTKVKRRWALFIGRLVAAVKPAVLQMYLLKNFLTVLFVCLLASISLFLVFELFERINVFIKEGASATLIFSYLFYKVPLIAQLMMPIAVLIATLLSVGRLSQLSEITAMRACGISIFFLARPLIGAGIVISLLMFISGETIVPAATQKVEEIYHLDIKKKVEKGTFSKSNFWYRKGRSFFNIGLYDSRTATLKGISVYELDKNFKLLRRTDAREAVWGGNPAIGWTMSDVVEIATNKKGGFDSSVFNKAPLVIDEQPRDFYNMERSAEGMSYRDLKRYTEKLKSEGVLVTNYLVALAAKLSFPLINLIVVLIAFPFALIPARSGSLTTSFVAGVMIGFGYYVVHALSMSLANGELIPIECGAWTANILFACIGGYLMCGAETKG
ncbi:MAG: LPS export ABC transporter permease LptG [Bdellovibrionota bacterium]